MDRLKLFRFATFHYFIEQFSLAEGLTETIRIEIRPTLEKWTENEVLVDRMAQMNTKERFRTISDLLDLVKPFENATWKLPQSEWRAKVKRTFQHESSDSSNIVGNEDPTASVYELSRVQIPGAHIGKYLATVLTGCSIISLDEVLVAVGVEKSLREELKENALKDYDAWRLLRPKGVQLYVKYQDAAEVCKAHSVLRTAPIIIEWLEEQALVPSDNPDDHQRLRLLEAVDASKYVITSLGNTTEKGHLVLLRASDGYVHIASFLRSCAGLPLRKQDVRDDDECASLQALLNGPVVVLLDETQVHALTLPVPQQDIRATYLQELIDLT